MSVSTERPIVSERRTAFALNLKRKKKKQKLKKEGKVDFSISLRMVCPQLFGQVIGNLLQQEM